MNKGVAGVALICFCLLILFYVDGWLYLSCSFSFPWSSASPPFTTQSHCITTYLSHNLAHRSHSLLHRLTPLLYYLAPSITFSHYYPLTIWRTSQPHKSHRRATPGSIFTLFCPGPRPHRLHPLYLTNYTTPLPEFLLTGWWMSNKHAMAWCNTLYKFPLWQHTLIFYKSEYLFIFFCHGENAESRKAGEQKEGTSRREGR